MKLLVFDVEGTLFETIIRLPGTIIDSTIWQSIAHNLGPLAVSEEIETHSKWQRREYTTYIKWMEETIAIHIKHGLTKAVFTNLIETAKYSPGIPEIMPKLDPNNYTVVLVSGGFRELTIRAQRDFKIRHAFAACEYIFGESGLLEGFNLLPCDFSGKLDFIQMMINEYRLADDEWIFVGDGANDIPIATRAPISIGYRPHSDLAKVVTHVISDFRELPQLLSRV